MDGDTFIKLPLNQLQDALEKKTGCKLTLGKFNALSSIQKEIQGIITINFFSIKVIIKEKSL